MGTSTLGQHVLDYTIPSKQASKKANKPSLLVSCAEGCFVLKI